MCKYAKLAYLSFISYQLSNLFSEHKTSSFRRSWRRDLTARCALSMSLEIRSETWKSVTTISTCVVEVDHSKFVDRRYNALLRIFKYSVFLCVLHFISIYLTNKRVHNVLFSVILQ